MKMLLSTARRTLANENGFVLGASILISAILLLAGVLALWTSNNEMHIVRNEGQLTMEFYNAEGGIIDAMEKYDARISPTQYDPMAWLTGGELDENDNFLLDGETRAHKVLQSQNTEGQTLAKVEVRCISNLDPASEVVENLSPAANHLPRQPHIAPPPSGSGFSLKYFEVRRYGITATSTTGNTQV
ncbi:MAG: hypothetical protein R6V84_00595, partial [Desulfobacterales bacterium]